MFTLKAVSLFSMLSLWLCTSTFKNTAGDNNHIISIRPCENPASGIFKETNGKEWNERVAPYTDDYLKQNNINTNRLINSLFHKIPVAGKKQYPIIISSYYYSSGDWRYVTSNSILIYEVKKGTTIPDSLPFLFVLYNDSLPQPAIIDNFNIHWNCALMDTAYRVLSKFIINNKIKYKEDGLFDMVYTGAEIDSNAIIVKTMYAHTGGAGGRNQEFTSKFSILKNPFRLHHISTMQTLDEYNMSEYEKEKN